MKRIYRCLCCLLLCLTLLPSAGRAEQSYLIRDSDTRLLTAEELWAWDYESLGYVLNEIFARHGYNFIPGQKYDYYFRCMPWYTPNEDANNQRACYSQLSSVEWANERLVKEVRQQMRDLGTTNPQGRSVWDTFSTGFDSLQGFAYVEMPSVQTLPVYAGPGYHYWRGANGKACVSTNGNVLAAGWENGWLLVMYETNNGSVRVGYVSGQDIKGAVPLNTYLTFEYSTAQVTTDCQLTDDPARCYAAMTSLRAGDSVTYLTTYFNTSAWAYVETSVDGTPARGFLPASALATQGE